MTSNEAETLNSTSKVCTVRDEPPDESLSSPVQPIRIIQTDSSFIDFSGLHKHGPVLGLHI